MPSCTHWRFALLLPLLAVVGCGGGGGGGATDLKRNFTFKTTDPQVIWFAALKGEQNVTLSCSPTGRPMDCYLIRADSEQQATDLVKKNWDIISESFQPDPSVLLNKVLGTDNGSFDATIPGGKAFAVVIYPRPPELKQKLSGSVRITMK